MPDFENPNVRSLQNALVQLTAPDGRVFSFRYAALIPYAGRDYAVLQSTDETDGEQMLITRMVERDGELTFEVAQEEDVIQAVFEKYVADAIRQAMEDAHEQDD